MDRGMKSTGDRRPLRHVKSVAAVLRQRQAFRLSRVNEVQYKGYVRYATCPC